MKSPLKWAGGKKWIIEFVCLSYFPFSSYRFIEPFCGGCSVSFEIRPFKVLCNDTLLPLINFYRYVQNGLLIPTEWQNTKEDFERLRRRFNEVSGLETEESAALFYYLNQTCFNGLCRFNSKGEFNSPYGGGEDINRLKALAADYQNALSHFEFRHGDFETLQTTERDFIYADPPYDTEFNSYSTGGFSWSDQLRTARWLASRSGPVIVSNQATERVIALYTSLGFEITYENVRRSIRSHTTVGGKTPEQSAREIIATRNL